MACRTFASLARQGVASLATMDPPAGMPYSLRQRISKVVSNRFAGENQVEVGTDRARAKRVVSPIP